MILFSVPDASDVSPSVCPAIAGRGAVSQQRSFNAPATLLQALGAVLHMLRWSPSHGATPVLLPLATRDTSPHDIYLLTRRSAAALIGILKYAQSSRNSILLQSSGDLEQPLTSEPTLFSNALSTNSEHTLPNHLTALRPGPPPFRRPVFPDWSRRGCAGPPDPQTGAPTSPSHASSAITGSVSRPSPC